jgi:hypothetical protein
MESLSFVEIDIPEFKERTAGFNGTTAYLTRGAGLSGAADSKLMTASFWIKPKTGFTGGRVIAAVNAVGGGSNNTRIIQGGGTTNVTVIGVNAGGTDILSVTNSGGASLSVDVWHHVLMSFDLANVGNRWMYVDDVSSLSVTTYTNDTMDFTMADWGIAGRPDGSAKLGAELADVWFMPGLYLDLSVEANRRRFISSDGFQVNLGPTGALPTGSAPLIFLSGNIFSWETNKGTGGGFTNHGTLDAVEQIPRTYRFAIDAAFLPRSFDAIPNVKSIDFSPATLSLGVDLGQRAQVTVKFRDHRHIWDGEGFTAGSI